MNFTVNFRPSTHIYPPSLALFSIFPASLASLHLKRRADLTYFGSAQ